MELSLETILAAHRAFETSINGGVIHDFLKEMTLEFLDDDIIPVYLFVHHYQGKKVVIGGNYAKSGKPILSLGQNLDFFFRCSDDPNTDPKKVLATFKL